MTAPAKPFPRDSHVTHPAEIRRAMSAGVRILARLEQGPATARELADITLKYTQRLSDLRKAGYDVQCSEAAGGLSTYYLRGARGFNQNAPRDGRLV